MTTLREAAQQALEAMEYHVEQTRSIWKTSQAIDALRDALAQQDEPKGGGNLPPPLQAVPVARVLQTVGQYHTGRFVAEVETVRRLRDGESLYTAPPRREWRGLTDDEISALFPLPLRSDYKPYSFARAIEAALKEKNQ